MSSTTDDVASTDDVVVGLEVGAFAIAILLSIFLSCFERNKRGGRPGIVVPINFLKDDNLAIVYTAAFGCTSIQLLNLILLKGFVLDSFNIPRLVIPWVRVFVWLIMALFVSLKFYPVFAVIRCKRIIIEPLIGLFYTSFIFSSLIYQLTNSLGVKRVDAYVLVYIPTSLCYVILIGYFLYTSVRQTYSFVRRLKHDTDNEGSKPCTSKLQYNYVKWLLKNPERDIETRTDTGLKRSIQECSKNIKNKIGVRSPLHASPRVIATFVVAAIALFQVGMDLLTSYIFYQPGLQFTTFFKLKFFNTSGEAFLPEIETFFIVADAGFYTSISLSSIFMVVYIIAIFISYRKDLEKMQRGDYTFLPMKLRKSLNDNLVASSLRYSGVQIAFLIWCYILIILMLWILCFMIAYIIILPLAGKIPFSFFEPVLIILPLVMMNFGFKKLQVFLSRTFFQQDFTVIMSKGLKTQKALALDNLKIFNILSFFMFFFHVIIGFISCINRILIGLLIGLVSLARIDKCMLPRGFEKFDKGYSTYIGMLMVEVHHRNPVASVFCDELLVINKETGCANVLLTPVKAKRGKVETNSQKHRRICRKWSKLYTLINNPSARRNYVEQNFECSIDQVEIAM
ncbi:stimulated by retinoic acid gene 6 protein-like [Mytilus californianus]|uniref:stimulated by retinoic acid gene 6 protein-like n=1 Tax=Mytilus californianus TaxID=6549 RepID=UPI00224792C8|nr:stimulated by retinoic acid gene 6 protein-like [Mytilus californianus]